MIEHDPALFPQQAPLRSSGWWVNSLFIGGLLLLSLLFFWRVPVLGYVLLPLDNLYTYEPWRSEVYGANAIPLWNPATTDGVRAYYPLAKIITESWRQGEIPFWNPYALTGMPVLAAGTYQALYPIANLLRLTMPVAQAISWSIILHFFLGSLFTFLFVRELGSGPFGAMVAAVAFVFNSTIMIWLTFPSVVETMFWMPLILWGWERALRREQWRWLVVSVAAIVMQILAGQVQMVYYSATGAGLYALYRGGVDGWQKRRWRLFLRPVRYLAVSYGAALLLAAVQVLPFLELAAQGARGDAAYRFQPVVLALFRLLVPDFFGTQIDGFITGGYKFTLVLYFGLVSLIFLAASLFSSHRVRAWGFFGIGALVLLVVFQTPPLHQIFSALYPTYTILGFDRALFLAAFFWAAAAGLGGDALISTRPQKLLRYLLAAGWVIFGVALAGSLLFAFLLKYQPRHFWNLPPVDSPIPPEYRLGSILFALFFWGAALLLLGGWSQKKLSRPVFGSLTLLLLVSDLFLANIDYFPAYPPDMLSPTTPSLDFLNQQVSNETRPYRIVGMGRVLWSDMAGVFHLPDVQGYDSFITRRYSRYINATGVRGDTNYRIAAFEPKTSPLLDALNTAYLYVSRRQLGGGDWVSLINEAPQPQVESPVNWAGQVGEWTIAGWTQPVVLAPASSTISYQGQLSFPSVLETAIALDAATPPEQTGTVQFQVVVKTLEDPAGQILFDRQLDIAAYLQNPTWQPVAVDLGAFTQKAVQLSLIVNGPPGLLAGWANPLLSDSSKVELLYYGPNSIYLNKNHLPRAWIVHQIESVPLDDLDSAAAILTQPDFDPARTAVIEGNLSTPPDPPAGDDSVMFDLYSANRSVITANLASSGLLVFSDIYYPGWNAYVDGVRQPVYAANIAMRGVYVPAGEHRIEFKYEPLSFRLGVIISGVTVGLLIIAVGIFYYRRRSGLRADSKML